MILKTRFPYTAMDFSNQTLDQTNHTMFYKKKAVADNIVKLLMYFVLYQCTSPIFSVYFIQHNYQAVYYQHVCVFLMKIIQSKSSLYILNIQ